MYLEEYLDTLEALPAELQRSFTLMRELDALSQDITGRIETKVHDYLQKLPDLDDKTREANLQEFAQFFSSCLKHGEEKVMLATQTYDLVDRHIRKLDEDLMKFEDEQMTTPKLTSTLHGNTGPQQAVHHGPFVNGTEGRSGNARYNDTYQGQTGDRRPRSTDKRSQGEGGGNSGALKKRRGREASPAPNRPHSSNTSQSDPVTNGPRERGGRSNHARGNAKRDAQGYVSRGDRAARKAALESDMAIDPNEPTYCFCNQVSYGEMVACDDDNCEIEWFHYQCVGLNAQPKGKWYCRDCTIRRKQKR